ncbi:MAG: BrnA antitoxin family protein [Roseiarcus sp.]
MSEKLTTVRYSLSEIKAKRARGEDATRVDAPEAEFLGEGFWNRARVVMPRGKTSVHLRLDSDIVDWFKASGKGHLTRMNAVLASLCGRAQGGIVDPVMPRLPQPGRLLP